LLTACQAQPNSSQAKDTTAYKPGKHHFKFTENGMYYNGVQFHLGDSIQAYVKIFGPYSRRENLDLYIWDSLGMSFKTPPPDRPRVSAVDWQVSYPQDYFEADNSTNHYRLFPKLLIPEPLDIEKCGVVLTRNIRFREVLRSTNCFYQSAIHTVYKAAGYTETDQKAFHNIYYYINAEVYDEAEGKTPYGVVEEFTVSTED
jgi:hypothetical protein